MGWRCVLEKPSVGEMLRCAEVESGACRRPARFDLVCVGETNGMLAEGASSDAYPAPSPDRLNWPVGTNREMSLPTN